MNDYRVLRALIYLIKVSDSSRVGECTRVRELFTNTKRAQEVLSTLCKLGLVKVVYVSRTKYIVLTEKGRKVKSLLREAVSLAVSTETRGEYSSLREEYSSLKDIELPEYLKDNPWISVLATRGKKP